MKNLVLRMFVLLFLLLQYSCSFEKEVIAKQVSSNYPIILLKGINVDRIAVVQIPLVFYLRKHTLRQIEMSIYPKYLYGHLSPQDYFYGNGCTLYAHEKGELQSLMKVQKLGFLSKKYVVYTRHRTVYLREEKFRLLLQPYLEEMIKTGKDRLEIGSIQELKKTQPELLNAFLLGDSITFKLFQGEALIPYTFPVEMK